MNDSIATMTPPLTQETRVAIAVESRSMTWRESSVRPRHDSPVTPPLTQETRVCIAVDDVAGVIRQALAANSRNEGLPSQWMTWRGESTSHMSCVRPWVRVALIARARPRQSVSLAAYMVGAVQVQVQVQLHPVLTPG